MPKDEKVEQPKNVDSERAALYERANKANATPVEPSKPEGKTPDSGTETPAEKKEPVKELPKVPEIKPEPEVKPEVDKVPHAALHEEREKRKAAQEKLRVLEEQNRQLEERQKTLMADVQQLVAVKGKEEQPIDDIEQALRDIRKENEELRKRFDASEASTQKREEWERGERIKVAQETLARNLDSANAELEKSGIAGFKKFVPLVEKELRALVQEDPENASLDNPQGWMKIYKERVYPTVRDIFRQEKVQEKEEKKKEADIPTGGNSGAGAHKPEEEKWDNEKYLKMRLEQAKHFR